MCIPYEEMQQAWSEDSRWAALPEDQRRRLHQQRFGAAMARFEELMQRRRDEFSAFLKVPYYYFIILNVLSFANRVELQRFYTAALTKQYVSEITALSCWRHSLSWAMTRPQMASENKDTQSNPDFVSAAFQEQDVTSSSSWTALQPQLSADSRHAVLGEPEAERLFRSHVAELKATERKQRHEERDREALEKRLLRADQEAQERAAKAGHADALEAYRTLLSEVIKVRRSFKTTGDSHALTSLMYRPRA